MQITRRALALTALAGAAAADAQPPAANDIEDAKKQVAEHSETLLRFDLPMGGEPVFVFKP